MIAVLCADTQPIHEISHKIYRITNEVTMSSSSCVFTPQYIELNCLKISVELQAM